MTMSGIALSPWSPRQVALRALLDSSRAWFGSASCCPGLAEGKAALVQSASLEARPLALPTRLTLAPLQSVRSRKLSTGLISHSCLSHVTAAMCIGNDSSFFAFLSLRMVKEMV